MLRIAIWLLTAIILMSSSCEDVQQHNTPSPTYDYEVLTPKSINYGSDSIQFGDLRLPETDTLVPLIMIIHGGCWLSSYHLDLMDSMAHELTIQGYATWNIEYRRTGDPGGGWPGTFLDVANALEYVKTLATTYPIDLDNILITGHSAGGHLALMLGANANLPQNSDIKTERLPNIKGIVSLAGITDLATYYRPNGCGSNVKNLMDGLPEEQPERYTEASPITHVPLGVPTILINGEVDNIVPLSHVTPYYDLAADRGEDIDLVSIPNAGHFEVITPGSIAWDLILEAFKNLVTE